MPARHKEKRKETKVTAEPARPPLPPARPFKRNRLFLIIAAALFTLWALFLAVMALRG